jgi:hypothetical protein
MDKEEELQFQILLIEWTTINNVYYNLPNSNTTWVDPNPINFIYSYFD